MATYVEAVRQLSAYAARMSEHGRLGEIEELLIRIGLGEYLAQIAGGIPMSQGEIVRLVRPRLDAGRCRRALEAGARRADRRRQHGGAIARASSS